MDKESLEAFVGKEGSAGMSGGCVVPQELDLKFRILEQDVLVEINDQWFSTEEGRLEGAKHISHERYLAFAAILKALFEAPAIPATFSSSSMGAGARLPTPDGEVYGGGSEMEESPPSGPIINAIEEFAKEIFDSIPKPKEAVGPEKVGGSIPYDPDDKTVRNIMLARFFLPFLIPITIVVVVVLLISRKGASSVGEECVSSGDCQDLMCNITDTGYFWIFGMEGYCTKPCGRSNLGRCPSNMRCEYTTFKQHRGTGLAHTYVGSKNYYCVPKSSDLP